MNIAAVILWYLIGYFGCIWTLSRVDNVTLGDLGLFLICALFGPIVPATVFLCSLDSKEVVIRRRK